MGVHDHEYGEFRHAVKQLIRAGRVIRGGGNCIMLPDATDTFVGTFRGNPRGFGFVVPQLDLDHGDLFIPPPNTMGAISGDTVLARITQRDRQGMEGRVSGQVVEILERGNSRFVGELVQEGKQWLVWADGKVLHTPILIPDAKSTRAKPGDQVVVEITQFPSADQIARGVIVEVLGRRGEPGIDTLSIIRQYNLPEGFEEEVLQDARAAIQDCDPQREAEEREDLRDEMTITIDPDDARDFDDAISLRKLKGGELELGVHIADVSRLVLPDAPLDKEARRRCNSVYLPQHVIPMLPEVLSNGLCSLQENEVRLTKSAFITYDRQGRRKGARFANSAIQSNKRLTYHQATDIIEGRTDGYSDDVVALVKSMEQLARRIRERRLKDGMVVLDLPGIELVLDDEGTVTGVEPEDTSFSHTVIEMFMVEANEVVAELFVSLDVPHLRRVHEEPPEDTQAKLIQFLRVLGRPIPKTMDREAMNRLLDSVRGKPESFPVHLAVLRSMSQAMYSPASVGHFALASKHYCHFTSPIRRYPDLVVHRLLQMYFDGQLRTQRGKKQAPSEETLRDIGRKCSVTERQAESAERELRLVKLLYFLEEHVGDVEEGVVTGVTNAGIFVQLVKYQVDGLIRLSELSDDWWEFHENRGCVVGQATGQRIAIGDAVRVQIVSVDTGARELNLKMLESLSRGRSGKSENASGGKDTGKGKGKSSKGGQRGRGKRASSSSNRGGGKSRAGGAKSKAGKGSRGASGKRSKRRK